MRTASACPLCVFDLLEEPQDVFATGGKAYSCPNCGPFELDEKAKVNLPLVQRDTPNKLPVLSHAVRMMSERTGRLKLTWDLVERIVSTSDLPSPAGQVENLLLWLGSNSRYFGESTELRPNTHTAIAGAANADNFVAVARELLDQGYFEGKAALDGLVLGNLSLRGRLAYEDLQRGLSGSRKAFMAMLYGDIDLDKVFSDCFKPAVLETGFMLGRLDEDAPAGLIDDRLRVEIRTSRFLIADLTGGNQGAYWEAGYAEGLGRPVIYTCEKSYFDHHKTHFDANHHLTITWKEERLEEAAISLKATIRATLPAEAILEDPEGGS